MDLDSDMIETFGRGVYIGAKVKFQNGGWYLQEWIWDRPEFQKRYYTNRIHNLAIF